MKRAVFLVGAMAVVLCLALAGCKKAQEKAIENKLAQEGINAKVDSSGDKITIHTKDGNAIIAGKGTSVPENFPKDVYVYEGATITASITVPNGVNLVMETADGPEKVLGTIKAKMSSLGWQEEMSMNQGKSATLSYKKGQRAAFVVVAAEKTTHINVTATEHN